MSELSFECLDVQPDRYGAGPTLLFRLGIAETTGTSIHAMALRCQLRIEPHRRRYDEGETERLGDLFGDVSRWGETLKPMQLASLSVMVPSFTGHIEVEMAVPCTYDQEVASAKYFEGLREGEVPLLLLFSGTVFYKAGSDFNVQQVPWHKEAEYRLPVSVWKEAMDLHFPGQVWIRMREETLESLQRFKTRRVLLGWDDTLEALLKEAGEDAT